MAEKSMRPKRSWGPMLAFLGVVVGVIALLWWMSRPASSSTDNKSSPTSTPSLRAPTLSSGRGAPGAAPSTAQKLCSVAEVKKFIASQLAAGEVPDSDLQQIATHVMNALKQAGLAEQGCVTPADVTAALYDMADDEGMEEGF